MRSVVADIPKHRRYTADAAGPFTFAGMRQVAGQTLALLAQGGDVLVMPIDEPTARRLKRVALGDPVTPTPRGSIKTRGGRGR